MHAKCLPRTKTPFGAAVARCVCGSGSLCGMGSIRIMQLNVVNKMLTPLPLNPSTADVSTSEHN